jgi:purine-binding chemotaxis protein CheW
MDTLIRSERQSTAPDAQEAGPRGQQYLTFTVAGEMFAVGIAAIKEIIEYRAPTDVPMMPSFMRGVINLRGRVVPVIDLSARFGRTAASVTRRSCIVILEIGQHGTQDDIGVLVDAVSAVVEIADGDIEPPPSFGARLRSDFISGMSKLAGKFVIVLEIGRVLGIEELSSLGAPGAGDNRPSQVDAALHFQTVSMKGETSDIRR